MSWHADLDALQAGMVRAIMGQQDQELWQALQAASWEIRGARLVTRHHAPVLLRRRGGRWLRYLR